MDLQPPSWVLPSIGALPFAASLAFFGMPHGAADGLIAIRWARRRSHTASRLAVLAAAYTAGIAATIAGLIAFPAAGLFLFLLVSVTHFALAGARLFPWDTRVSAFLTAGTLVLLPFATRATATTHVFSEASVILGADTFPPGLAAAAAVAGVACAGALLAIIMGRFIRREQWYGPAGVLAGIVCTHTLLPPLFAVGVWFLAWHAVPETHRIGRWLRPDAGLAGRVLKAHLAAAPLLIPTLAGLAAALWLAPTTQAVPLRRIAIGALVAYAALTPAHLVFQETIAARVLGRRHPTRTPLPPQQKGSRRDQHHDDRRQRGGTGGRRQDHPSGLRANPAGIPAGAR